MLIEAQRGFQRREGHFIRAQGPLQRMALQPGNQRAFADDNPGLRAAEQLVAGETDQAHPGGDHLLRHRLLRQAILAEIHQRPAAQVGHHRDVQFAANGRQLRFVDGFGKALNTVVAGVDLHQQRGIVIHRLAIIFGMGAVGGTHFVQLATRLAHHVGDAKCPADLHQFAARDHHFATAGGGRQHQQNGRRVVVHDTGVFRAGDLAQQIGNGAIAMAAPGVVEIIFERHRRAHRAGNRLHGRLRLDGAPQIGMQYRTGEIKHRTQGAPLAGGEPLLTGVLPVMAPVRERLPLANLFPRLIQHLAQLRHHLRMAVLRQQGRKSGVA